MKTDDDFNIPEDILNNWQTIVDTMAKIIGIPSGLIMKIASSNIEVFISSKTDGNPYHPGEKAHLIGSGLYCERVIKTKSKLLVPNALKEENWEKNPDVKLNMISYLGFPILFPDGNPFGTICVLDKKENKYSALFEELIIKFRDLIQNNIAILYMNKELNEKNKTLNDYISEIKTLRGILPICSYCKKVRNDNGYWQQVEDYIKENTEALCSHGLCPECYQKEMGKLKNL